MSTDRFDALAAEWDDHPIPNTLAAALFEFIQRNAAPSQETRALDYGCGTGLLTLRLAEIVGSAVGLDAAEGMLEVCQKKIEALGAQNVEVARHVAPAPIPSSDYTLITASMVLHHIPDVPAFLEICAGLLPPGGAVCFGDLDTEDGSFHPEGVEIEHKGFDRGALAGWLEAAGFEAPHFETIREFDRDGKVFSVFGVYARRAA